VNKPIEILGQNDFDNYQQKKFSAFSYAHSMVEVNTKLRANGINKLVIRESDYISQLPIPARNSIRIPLFILIDYADD